MSVISEIIECVRPEFENLTQRTANPVVPENKSRKNVAPGKMGAAELLKTGVFWQALTSTREEFAAFIKSEIKTRQKKSTLPVRTPVEYRGA